MNSLNHCPGIRLRTIGFVCALAGCGITLPGALAQSYTTVIESREKFRPPRSRVLQFGSFGEPSFNDRGDVAFFGSVFGRQTNTRNNTIIAMKSKGKVKLLSREGTEGTVRRVGTVTPSDLGRTPQINQSRRVAYFVELEADDGFLAVANPKAKSVGFVGLTGFDPSTVEFGFNRKKRISILANDTAVDDSPQSVFRVAGRNLDPLVAVDEIPIGLPITTTFTGFGDPVIDNNDQLFFTADISEDADIFDGIWYGRTGDPTPLVTIFDVAPNPLGAAGSNKFDAFDGKPGVSPDGDNVAFAATVSGTQGIYRADVSSGAVSFVTNDNGSLFAPNGAVVSQLQDFRPPAINNSGDIAFLVQAKTVGVEDAADTLLYYPANGTPTVIAAVGQVLPIDGVEREVINLRFGSASGINTRGQVVFTASFGNRSSGIYIYNP